VKEEKKRAQREKEKAQIRTATGGREKTAFYNG